VHTAGGGVLVASRGVLEAVTLDADLVMGNHSSWRFARPDAGQRAQGAVYPDRGLATLNFTGNSQTLAVAARCLCRRVSNNMLAPISMQADADIARASRCTAVWRPGGKVQANSAIVNHGTISADASGQTIFLGATA